MKVCSRCGKKGEFAKNVSRKDGLQPYCKSCHSKYTRQHYHNNKDVYVAKSMAQQKVMRRLIDLLKTRPCKDCKESYPPWVMDFDHKRDKVINIARLLSHGSKRRIMEEAKKCDVVCSNCHRQRTHKRRLRRLIG